MRAKRINGSNLNNFSLSFCWLCFEYYLFAQKNWQKLKLYCYLSTNKSFLSYSIFNLRKPNNSSAPSCFRDDSFAIITYYIYNCQAFFTTFFGFIRKFFRLPDILLLFPKSACISYHIRNALSTVFNKFFQKFLRFFQAFLGKFCASARQLAYINTFCIRCQTFFALFFEFFHFFFGIFYDHNMLCFAAFYDTI